MTDEQKRIVEFIETQCEGSAHRYFGDGSIKLAGLTDGRPRVRLRVWLSGDYGIDWDFDGVMKNFESTDPSGQG